MCMNGADCDPETGTCVCKPGWRGRLCQKGTGTRLEGQALSER